MRRSTVAVELLTHTPLSNAAMAARTCWQSWHKGGCYPSPTDNLIDSDMELLHRLRWKFKHESIFEHVVYTFNIKGLPRAVLQELARHRLLSLSVKSTRYTLKELRDERPFRDVNYNGEWFFDEERASRYVFFTGDERVDGASIMALEQLRQLVVEGVSNDVAKFALPESYKCDLVMTCNMRELAHIVKLRTDKSALWAFQSFAWELYRCVPASHKPLILEHTLSPTA